MSDKSLRFLLFGEDKTASSSMHHVADEAHSATSRIGGLFSKLGSGIQGEIGELVTQVGEGFEKMGEESKSKLGGKLMAVGGIVGGLGVAMQSMASTDVAAQQQLKAAVDATGKSYEGFGEDVEKAIAHQERYGHTAVDTQEALRTLTQAYQDPKKALAEMNLVSDLAASKHITLAAAAQMVAKAHGGSTRIFKEFGMSLAGSVNPANDLAKAEKAHTAATDNLAKAQRALQQLEERDHAKKKLTIADHQALENAQRKVSDAQAKLQESSKTLTSAQKAMKDGTTNADAALKTLAERLHGQASAASDTFGGKLAAMRAHVTDVGLEVATKMGPALTVAGPILLGVGAIIESGVVPALGKGAVAMAKMGARAIVWGAEMLASGIEAMIPFLPIIAIVAAVGVAAFLLYKHWDTVWGGIKSVTNTVWGWLKGAFNWIVNTGIGMIRLEIQSLQIVWGAAWGGVRTATSATWNFLSGIFNAIVNVGISLVKREIQGFQTIWSNAWNGVQSTVQGAWNVISGIINNITSAIGGVASTISSALHSIPGLSSIGHALHIPGFASGVSDFGGGLALVGERGPELVHLPAHSSVTPSQPTMSLLSKAAAGHNGPLVHIENYNEAKQSPDSVAKSLMWELRTA